MPAQGKSPIIRLTIQQVQGKACRESAFAHCQHRLLERDDVLEVFEGEVGGDGG